LKAARFSCLSCLIVFAALFMAPTAGAVTNEEAIRPVVHEGSRADRGRQVLLDGEKVNQLVGNVHIWRDSFSVFCDSALNYVESNQYDFFDKVRVIRGRTILTCESAFYNRNTGDAEFHDKVRVIDGEIIGTSRRGEMKADGEIMRMIREARLVTPDYVVWGDTITRFEDTEEGEAHGHVRIVDPTAETLVTGGHAIFSGDGSTAIVDRDPELTSREQGSDPVISNARIMHFFRNDDLAVLEDSVRIRQGRSVATADSATIYGRTRMVLRGSPQLDDGSGSTMTAEEIVFFYTDGELSRVNLYGTARVVDTAPGKLAAIYDGLPDTNELTGDTIILDMKDGAPHRSLVLGGARSIYVPDEADDEVAFNDVAGDTIVIAFANRRIRQVDVLGTMKGEYSFLRLDQPAPPDTLAEAAQDSLPTALAAADQDSVPTAVAAPEDTLAPSVVAFGSRRELVEYNGHRGLFQLADRLITIQGDGQMIYGTMDLRAQEVRLDTGERELYASGAPLLIDNQTKLAGRELGYNFEHKTGAVREGVTSMDEYYYVGKHIKRFDEGEMKIRSGKMTSCDLDVPHYHFWADRMKIKMNDKMVAMPIVMKVGQVPVFALPFYFKSMESGRKSGILFPTFNFGWTERTGRYVRDWGYYWATNDYTDFTFRGDYNDRRELTWQINNVYRKRYAFDGGATFSKRSTFGTASQTKEWQLRWNHNQQTLFDYYKLRANIKMSSKSISRQDLINDVGQEVISGQQTSTVYMSRSWSEVNASLNFKRDEYVNAEDDDLLTDNQTSRQTFPQLSVNFRSQPILSSLSAGRTGNFLGEMLRNTYFRHSYNVSSTQVNKELTQHTTDTAKGSFSLDIKPPRVFIFNVSTGISSGHTWTRDIDDGLAYSFDETDSTYSSMSVYDEVQDTRTSLSINSSMSTTLYGIVNPRIGRLRGLRHTMRLSVSHRLSPTIANKQSRSESYSFSLGNRFDLKYAAAGSDSTEELKKMDGILDWSLGTSYSPDREKDERWGTINNNFTIKPGNNRNLKLTLTNSVDPQAMRVTSTRIVYGLNLSGRFDTGGQEMIVEQKRNSAIDMLGSVKDSTVIDLVEDEYDEFRNDPRDSRNSGYGNDYEDEAMSGFGNQEIRGQSRGQARDDTDGGRFIPWRFGSNFSYSKDHLADRITARVNMNVSATVTRYWKFAYRTTYDLESGKMNTQSWNLERDLHCWQMKFSRSVSSVDTQYGFVIALKSMPDIKVTRGKEDLVGGLGRLGGGMF
jgi:lipopolysaccharide export system protein LptA